MEATGKIFKLATVFSIIALTGCANLYKNLYIAPSNNTYVSAISKTESVMVIPFNNYIQQIEVARNLEMVLVNLGFNVKSYIVESKDVEKRTGSGLTGAMVKDRVSEVDAIGAESNKVTIERYRSNESMNADYSFEVLLKDSTGTVKVVKTKEKSVIAVCVFNEYSLEDDMKKCLSDKHMIVEKTQ